MCLVSPSPDHGREKKDNRNSNDRPRPETARYKIGSGPGCRFSPIATQKIPALKGIQNEQDEGW